MRHLLMLVLTACLLPTRAMAAEYSPGGQDTDGCYIVVGTDWAGVIRDGPKVYQCDGTQDGVQLRAAIAQAASDGGGIVRVLGLLQDIRPSGDEVAWSGSGQITDQDTLQVDTWDGSFDLDDVEQGHNFRIYDNDAVGGSNCATNGYEDDIVTTVESTTGNGTETIDFGHASIAGFTSYTNDDHVKFRRIVPLITLPAGVSLRGATQQTSRLYYQEDIAAGEYAVIATEEEDDVGDDNAFFDISNLDIRCTPGDSNSNSAIVHGVVKGRYGPETSMWNLGIWYCSGSGVVTNNSHGFRIFGNGWCENNSEHGIVVSGDHARITDWKVSGNDRTGLLLKNALQAYVCIRARVSDDNDGGDAHKSIGIQSVDSRYGSIQGCIFELSGNKAVGLWLDYHSQGMAVTGNSFHAYTGDAIKVIDVEAEENTIVGNAFRDLGATNVVAMEVDTSAGHINTIMHNTGDWAGVIEQHFVQMENTSGGELVEGDAVVLKAVAVGDEVTTTTTAGDSMVFGVVAETIADNAYGYVQTLGKAVAVKADGTDDISIGDLLSTFTTAKISQKAASGEMAFGVALEAYTTNDSNGVLDALLISPRQMK